MIRKWFLRFRIMVDLILLLSALAFVAVTIGTAINGDWGKTIPAGCIDTTLWYAVYRIARTGSFANPW